MTETYRKLVLINACGLFLVFLSAISCGKSGDVKTNSTIDNGNGIVFLSWTTPTTYSDNVTPLTVSGYKLYYGVSQRTYSTVLDLGNTNVAYKPTDLPSSVEGVYYFALTVYDASGNESDYSNEIFIML